MQFQHIERDIKHLKKTLIRYNVVTEVIGRSGQMRSGCRGYLLESGLEMLSS